MTSDRMKYQKVGNYVKNIAGDDPIITMSLGNGKLSHDILIFNLPAIDTCPNCDDCKDTCYARKPELRYPAVKPCRNQNLSASKKTDFVDRMVFTIMTAVSKHGVKAVRVHESGDFYSQSYAASWSLIQHQVKKLYPEVIFFAYTKSPYRPQGFNIVESILPDGEINYGPRDEIILLARKYGAKICPYGIAKRTLTCGVECKACQKFNRVVFVQH